ncbi:MAG: tRNA epoxyqueuosine(34) reductase QueG, partial [Pseudomonadota bacterium]
MRHSSLSPADLASLAQRIKTWGRELGFQQLGITDVDLAEEEPRLARWLAAGHQGEMGFMAKHGTRRTRPAELVPGTVRVISVRLDYLPAEVETAKVLGQP